MGSLVLGYDNSECAAAALGAAIELAKDTGDQLVVVFAFEPPGQIGEEVGAHRDALRELGTDVATPAVEQAIAAGVKAEARLVGQRPVDALVATADELDARMIIVGSYGESPLKSAILGSTPHKLLHVAERPVLVVSLAEE